MANVWKTFTEDEVKTLSENLWVRKVTPKLIRYTDEFKEEFLRQHAQGKTNREIVISLGFDPEMLGISRVQGMWMTVKDYAAKKQIDAPGPEIPTVSGSSTTAQLKRMQHKLSYMEQQIEFIKKTISADRKAGRSK